MLSRSHHPQIDFTAIKRTALAHLPAILNRLLPAVGARGASLSRLTPAAPITISDRSALILIPAAGPTSRLAIRVAIRFRLSLTSPACRNARPRGSLSGCWASKIGGRRDE
jgi:hypothetical protein